MHNRHTKIITRSVAARVVTVVNVAVAVVVVVPWHCVSLVHCQGAWALVLIPECVVCR